MTRRHVVFLLPTTAAANPVVQGPSRLDGIHYDWLISHQPLLLLFLMSFIHVRVCVCCRSLNAICSWTFQVFFSFWFRRVTKWFDLSSMASAFLGRPYLTLPQHQRISSPFFLNLSKMENKTLIFFGDECFGRHQIFAAWPPIWNRPLLLLYCPFGQYIAGRLGTFLTVVAVPPLKISRVFHGKYRTSIGPFPQCVFIGKKKDSSRYTILDDDMDKIRFDEKETTVSPCCAKQKPPDEKSRCASFQSFRHI